MRFVSVCKRYQANNTLLSNLSLELDADALHLERSSDNVLSHSGASGKIIAVRVLPRRAEFMSDK